MCGEGALPFRACMPFHVHFLQWPRLALASGHHHPGTTQVFSPWNVAGHQERLNQVPPGGEGAHLQVCTSKQTVIRLAPAFWQPLNNSASQRGQLASVEWGKALHACPGWVLQVHYSTSRVGHPSAIRAEASARMHARRMQTRPREQAGSVRSHGRFSPARPGR